MIVTIDYFTRQGAQRLKRIIEDYWSRRGLAPHVRVVEQNNTKDGRPIFVLRSDLAFDQNGYPYVRKIG